MSVGMGIRAEMKNGWGIGVGRVRWDRYGTGMVAGRVRFGCAAGEGKAEHGLRFG